MSHISDPNPKKKKCTARPEEGQGMEGWRLVKKYVERGINLNASDMCWQMGEDLTN